MIDFNKLKLLGNWALVEKDKSKMHKLIELPDSVAMWSPMGRVLKLGPDHPRSIGVGQIIIEKCNSKWKKAHMLRDSKTGIQAYLIPCGEIVARQYEDQIIPIGRRVLVERLIGRNALSETIENIDYSKANLHNLMVRIVRYGLTEKGYDFKYKDLPKIGEVCKLKSWEMHQFELGILNRYHLIVNEEDLEYKEI